jgi:hypothetical protein
LDVRNRFVCSLPFTTGISFVSTDWNFRMNRGRVCWSFAIRLFLVMLAAGCGSGQKSGRPDIDAIPEEELRGAAVKNSLYEFRAKVKKRGVSVAKAELPDLLEGLESYEKQDR